MGNNQVHLAVPFSGRQRFSSRRCSRHIPIRFFQILHERIVSPSFSASTEHLLVTGRALAPFPLLSPDSHYSHLAPAAEEHDAHTMPMQRFHPLQSSSTQAQGSQAMGKQDNNALTPIRHESHRRSRVPCATSSSRAIGRVKRS